MTDTVIPEVGKCLEVIICIDPDDDVVKGVCIYEPDKMYIHTFYITEKLRGKGNGRGMISILDTIGKMWTVAIADPYLDSCKGFWEKFRFEYKYSVKSTTKTSSVYARY
ncbi:MAG: hypothetical protein ACRCX2_11220 [Paraclostridium sp.]